MPGLRLTEGQVQRLWDVTAPASASALRALVSTGFLRALEDGGYQRADIAINSRTRSTSGGTEAPWRRILCLVEFDDDRRGSLTAASHAALCYATTLGVTHRARVTALHLTPELPDTTVERHTFLERVAAEIRRRTLGLTIPGLIDVDVATGSSSEGLLRSARAIGADLIVLGRRGGGAGCLSQFREMLRDAPCHVLVVHPSGQAAVA